ncbi:MAG TPA: hypothetical protein PLE85_10975 [Bacteroidales bacterium]|nr:hypothetical protein [Bacteroidales bacterium]
MNLPNVLPRSSRTIGLIILAVLVLFVVDQYRNKNFFGFVKPKA